MKQNKKPLFIAAAIVAILLTSLTTFALPPSGGGGTECPDRCKTSDPTCCVTPGGSHYYGTLVQN